MFCVATTYFAIFFLFVSLNPKIANTATEQYGIEVYKATDASPESLEASTEDVIQSKQESTASGGPVEEGQRDSEQTFFGQPRRCCRDCFSFPPGGAQQFCFASCDANCFQYPFPGFCCEDCTRFPQYLQFCFRQCRPCRRPVCCFQCFSYPPQWQPSCFGNCQRNCFGIYWVAKLMLRKIPTSCLNTRI